VAAGYPVDGLSGRLHQRCVAVVVKNAAADEAHLLAGQGKIRACLVGVVLRQGVSSWRVRRSGAVFLRIFGPLVAALVAVAQLFYPMFTHRR
jgi:hypothetical protein